MTDRSLKQSILIVDDSPNTLELLQRNLASKKYIVFTASNVAEAVRFLEQNIVDLVVTDLKMPGASGMELIRHVRENLKDIEVMMITGYPTIQGAVDAVKTGADEYLAKPFTDEELFEAVERVFEKQNRRRTAEAEPRASFGAFREFIGESDTIKKVLNKIPKIATTPATVLISGESGTGKELVARAIHYNSSRKSGPFVAVNCGGIPETLLESELFGHVKGAFTGATETKKGFFQNASGGTIFLDEIAETTLAMQVRLLRVLQDKIVQMVGSGKPEKVDVRVIAATNKDLHKLVKMGNFREDLYYRLNVINLEIPPLRKRGDDILILTHYFANKYADELAMPVPTFSDRVLQALKNYDWPGNVRELENAIQRLIVLIEGDQIDVSDLPAHLRFSVQHGIGLDRPLAEVEIEHIRNVLASVDGNKTKAAEILEIDRKTLREKLKSTQSND